MIALAAGCSPRMTGPPDMAPNTLAPPDDRAVNGPVDGITCDSSEQLLFHIHAHLAIFADGQPELLAAGIGIGPPLETQNGFVVGGSCFSWLHTHDQSGIIHIESPVQRTYTLGDFFDIWGQPLSASQVGPKSGPVTGYANGQAAPGDPRMIPMNEHDVLQLDVGSPVVAPQPFDWPSGY
jgi:hypothetical protein